MSNDTIRMAREAGFKPHHNPDLYDCMLASEDAIERFAALARAAEREAIVEEFTQFMLEVDETPRTASTKFVSSLLRVTFDKFLEIIRARGRA
jgi:hypothetical protein